eukprot:3366853-Amphidinium_carterae.1
MRTRSKQQGNSAGCPGGAACHYTVLPSILSSHSNRALAVHAPFVAAGTATHVERIMRGGCKKAALKR